MDEPTKDFTTKEKRFINAYLGPAAGNASEAARLAGYKDGGEFGYRLLKKVEIRAHIDAVLMAEAMTPAEILHELRDVGTAEWRDFITVRTNPRTGETVEVKMDLSAKMKALELNGKYHKMFSEKMELSGNLTFTDLARIIAQEEEGEDDAE
ncbi:MAG: terminase small subunit [Thermomicrobia bacterium]|nr:terminase small subunit [Thermomicrobia bacterium]MCA1722756.1 terminase small subunit [Thermomicrobia bacterium]